MPQIQSDSWEAPVPFSERALPGFPTGALPDALRDFIEAEALATQTPVDLPAMLGLSVCAATLATKVVVEVKAG
jgi:replicative DNA helicase